MATNPDFSDLFFELNQAEARYLVVGAYAVIHYSEPRYTKDLDIWVDPSPSNAAQVYRALSRYGAPLEAVTPADFENQEVVYQIGIAPNRIDLLMKIEGLSFESAWEEADLTSYGGVPIRVLSLEQLITAKRIAGRPQDLVDVERLEEVLHRRRS